jgi:hypothetical protein
MGACSNLSPVEKCLATIVHGVDALQARNFTLAEGALRLFVWGSLLLKLRLGSSRVT